MSRSNHVTLRFLAEPNFGGKVHGGAIMKWLDQAGYTCAVGWTGDYCVTQYVGGIHFLYPVHVAELVELRAQIIRTGTSSMHIAIDVYSGDPMGTTLHRAAHCVMVFVALDPEGRPKPVPKWTPSSAVDVALEQYAVRLNEFRQQLDTEMEARLKWLDEQRPAVRPTHV